MEVKFKPKKLSLSQSYSSGIWFALINSENEQITEWVTCRDYLADVVRSILLNKQETIFGFNYDLENKFDDSCLNLIFVDDKMDMTSKIPLISNLLKEVSKELKFKAPKLTKVKNKDDRFPNDVYNMKLDKRCLNFGALISLFTFIPRVAKSLSVDSTIDKFSYDGSPNGNDRLLIENLRLIVESLKNNKELYLTRNDKNFVEGSISNFHSYTGITTYLNIVTKKYNPKLYPWHLELK